MDEISCTLFLDIVLRHVCLFISENIYWGFFKKDRHKFEDNHQFTILVDIQILYGNRFIHSFAAVISQTYFEQSL